MDVLNDMVKEGAYERTLVVTKDMQKYFQDTNFIVRNTPAGTKETIEENK